MTPAETIINKFGGLTAFSRALNHRHPTTVQRWKQRGFIPLDRYWQVMDAAEAMGITLQPADFLPARPEGEAA